LDLIWQGEIKKDMLDRALDKHNKLWSNIFGSVRVSGVIKNIFEAKNMDILFSLISVIKNCRIIIILDKTNFNRMMICDFTYDQMNLIETHHILYKEDCDSYYILKKMSFTSISITNRRLPPESIEDIPIGLPNVLNSCYMNAVLQVLLSIDDIRYFINKTYPEIKKKYPNVTDSNNISNGILNKLRKIFINHSNKCDVTWHDMADLHKEFGKVYTYFNNNEQHDAQEFMNIVLDYMQTYFESFDKNRNIQIINDLFNIKIRQVIMCGSCQCEKEQSLSCNIILIPIKETEGIINLQEEILRYSRFTNINCDCVCGKNKAAIKSDEIIGVSKFVIIVLNRFKYDSCVSKIKTKISYKRDDMRFSNLIQDCYRLKAVINHHGESPTCGHYTGKYTNCCFLKITPFKTIYFIKLNVATRINGIVSMIYK
jgi:ubiquitin C-terminal hydrolase